jgi:hypothetical protein
LINKSVDQMTIIQLRFLCEQNGLACGRETNKQILKAKIFSWMMDEGVGADETFDVPTVPADLRRRAGTAVDLATEGPSGARLERTPVQRASKQYLWPAVHTFDQFH